jgi:hypothetical protein
LLAIDYHGNERFYTEFIELFGEDSKVKYLFHGTKSNPELFLGDGFDENRMGDLDHGWYGSGFYLTSFLDYALCYQYDNNYTFSSETILETIEPLIRNNGGSFKILMMLCHLGNCRRINQRTNYKTGRWNPDIDSRYVVVQRGNPCPNPPAPDFPVFDEYVFKDKRAICPHFIVTLQLREATKLLVWRNTSFERYGNDCIFRRLKEKFPKVTMMAYDCDDDALHRIRKTKNKTSLFVISNRDHEGAQFLAKCRDAHVTTPMLVFCCYVRGWIPMEDVTITNSTPDVFKFVKEVVMAK